MYVCTYKSKVDGTFQEKNTFATYLKSPHR